jgi:hypothetical protein
MKGEIMAFFLLRRNSAPVVSPSWSDCQPGVLFPSFGTFETKSLSCEPEFFPDKWIVQHNNMPSHTALLVLDIWVKNWSWSWSIPPIHLCHPVWLLLVSCHDESPQGITSWNHKRDSGYNGHSKQLAGLLEVPQKVEMMVKFMLSCRRELLWWRPLQFRIKFNTVLHVSTVLLFSSLYSKLHN